MESPGLEKHLLFAFHLARNVWPWDDRDDALSYAREAVWRAWRIYPDDPCGLAKKVYRRRQIDAHRLLAGPQRREPGTRHELTNYVLGRFGRFAPEPTPEPGPLPTPAAAPNPTGAEPCRTCGTPSGRTLARCRRPERIHGNCRTCHNRQTRQEARLVRLRDAS